MSTNATTFDPQAFADEHDIPLADLEQYPLDGCARTRRGGAVDYPYRGCSVWLLPDTPMSLSSAAMDMRMMSTDDAAGRSGFTKLCTGLAQVVAGHDLPGLPQFYDNPSACEQAPAPLLFYIYQIVMQGEVPEDRPNVSSRGRGGSSIPRRSGRTTDDSSDARPRLVNG